LGTDLLAVARQRGQPARALNRPEFDVTDAASVQAALDAARPSVVLNTAAAHGAAQAAPADQAAFFQVNALGAWHLARWCWQNDAVFVHYSTDYVFGAQAERARPYTEADAACPTNLYGASKAAGEALVRAFGPRHYILRIASVYGAAGCRAKNNSNFVKMTLGKLRQGEAMQVVSDQIMSPTWTLAAARKTFDLLDAGVDFGLYHLAGQGACSWHEFASEIVRLAGGGIAVTPSATPPPAPSDLFLRPRYTALDNARLRAAGLPDLPPWQEALAEYIHTVGE
jgi:dTDP-4-dehydrorhamnose reductase